MTTVPELLSASCGRRYSVEVVGVAAVLWSCGHCETGAHGVFVFGHDLVNECPQVEAVGGAYGVVGRLWQLRDALPAGLVQAVGDSECRVPALDCWGVSLFGLLGGDSQICRYLSPGAAALAFVDDGRDQDLLGQFGQLVSLAYATSRTGVDVMTRADEAGGTVGCLHRMVREGETCQRFPGIARPLSVVRCRITHDAKRRTQARSSNIKFRPDGTGSVGGAA